MFVLVSREKVVQFNRRCLTYYVKVKCVILLVERRRRAHLPFVAGAGLGEGGGALVTVIKNIQELIRR